MLEEQSQKHTDLISIIDFWLNFETSIKIIQCCLDGLKFECIFVCNIE